MRNRYGMTVGHDCSGCLSKVVTFSQGVGLPGVDDSAWCACDFPDKADDMLLVEPDDAPVSRYSQFKQEGLANQVEAHLTMFEALREAWKNRDGFTGLDDDDDESYPGGFESHYEMSQWIGLWMKAWLDALPAGGPWDNYYDQMEAYCDEVARVHCEDGITASGNGNFTAHVADNHARELRAA